MNKIIKKRYAITGLVILALVCGLLFNYFQREAISQVKLENIIYIVYMQEACHRLGHIKESPKNWIKRLKNVDILYTDGFKKPLPDVDESLERVVGGTMKMAEGKERSLANMCSVNNFQYKGLDIDLEQ